MTDVTARVTEWVRLYTPRLLGVARAFARGDEEAEDLLQEMWIVAHREAGQFPSTAPVGAWLHAILLNVGRARWRRRQRRARLASLWLRGVDEATTGGALHVGPAVERELLWRAIAGLPGLQRRVLLLRIVDDMSTQQAAQALGVAEGTVKASLHRALNTLRKFRSSDLPLSEVGATIEPAARGENING